MRHPILRRLVQAHHVAILTGKPYLAKRGGILGAKPGIAAHTSLVARRGKARLGTLADQSAFKLRHHTEDLPCELALR